MKHAFVHPTISVTELYRALKYHWIYIYVESGRVKPSRYHLPEKNLYTMLACATG